MEPVPVDPTPTPTALDMFMKRIKDPAVWLILLITLLVGSDHLDKVIPAPPSDTTVVVNPPAPAPVVVPTPDPAPAPTPAPTPVPQPSVLIAGTQFIILDETGTRTSAADVEKIADRLKIGRYTAQSIPKAGEKIK